MKLAKVVLVITICALVFGCSRDERGVSGNSVKLSYKAEAALEYINTELPSEQRDVLLGRSSDSNAEANAIANLMQSGHLDGYAEYIEAMKIQK